MSKRFLIGQLGRFGDCLYATTIAKQIKFDFPDSLVTWAITPKYKSVLDLNPDIDEIWEVEADDDDYDKAGWKRFEAKALERKEKGEFDEIIFSQISPRNWINFNGTIRGTILSAYGRPITVDVSPVVKLSEKEIENVRKFAAEKDLSSFEEVVLFECSPGSRQSRVNLTFALEVAKTIVARHPKVCFILSTAESFSGENRQIIGGNALSFRENAELTKYCSLLVGCSSGISWLSASEAAKKLPALQLLDENFAVYAGMAYDFRVNGLDDGHILEMTAFDREQTVNCLETIFNQGFKRAKKQFHQNYEPNYFHLENLTKGLIADYKSSTKIKEFIENYVETAKKNGATISPKYKRLISWARIYGKFYHQVQAAESGFFYQARKLAKKILWEK